MVQPYTEAGYYDSGAPRHLTKKRRLLSILHELKNARTSIEDAWIDIACYVLPDRLRILDTDANRYDKKRQYILDAAATKSSGVLRSGMSAGITSPSRDWYRLTTPHPAMEDIPGVREWLHGVTSAMRFVHAQSNFYQIAPQVYEDMGNFGTGACLVERDLDTAIHLTHFPVGSYWIGGNYKGKTNCFAREFQMTVLDLIEKFALRDDEGTGDSINWDVLSQRVRTLWNNHQYYAMIEVTHMIYPNDDHQPNKLEAKYKKFQSCYYESAYNSESTYYNLRVPYEDLFLRESGYDYFPVLVPKWSVLGEDWWGSNCPGITALPDIKMLQKLVSRKLMGVDKMVDPATQGPTKLRRAISSTMPGRRTWVDIHAGQKGMEPIYMVDPRIMEVRQDIMETKQAISDYYYESVFLAITRDQRKERPTATEVREIHEEKITLIGPVLERLNVDFLSPFIDITFFEMSQLGMIPPAPEELQGMPLKVEYVSELVQQQKYIAIGSMDRFVGFIGGLAQFDPMVVHKLNIDKVVDNYANVLGIAPDSLKTDEEYQAVIQQIQQAQQAQMMSEQAQQMGSTAKDLSKAESSDGERAIDRFME